MLPESRVIARPSPFVSACEDTRRVRCSEAAAEAQTQYRNRSGEYRQPLLGRRDPQRALPGARYFAVAHAADEEIAVPYPRPRRNAGSLPCVDRRPASIDRAAVDFHSSTSILRARFR